MVPLPERPVSPLPARRACCLSLPGYRHRAAVLSVPTRVQSCYLPRAARVQSCYPPRAARVQSCCLPRAARVQSCCPPRAARVQSCCPPGAARVQSCCPGTELLPGYRAAVRSELSGCRATVLSVSVPTWVQSCCPGSELLSAQSCPGTELSAQSCRRRVVSGSAAVSAGSGANYRRVAAGRVRPAGGSVARPSAAARHSAPGGPWTVPLDQLSVTAAQPCPVSRRAGHGGRQCSGRPSPGLRSGHQMAQLVHTPLMRSSHSGWRTRRQNASADTTSPDAQRRRQVDQDRCIKFTMSREKLHLEGVGMFACQTPREK